MSARNIENKKERLLTILVTPFMSCSARLPVYTILISLVIDNTMYFGFLSLQGLVMMSLYLMGIVMALLASMVLKWFINIKEKSYFILELPVYRAPRWGNVGMTMIQKAKIFVVDAGKVIIMISLLLWFLSSYGPGEKMDQLNTQYTLAVKSNPTQAARVLRHSFWFGSAFEFPEPLRTMVLGRPVQELALIPRSTVPWSLYLLLRRAEYIPVRKHHEVELPQI
jgi:ferrous iron transport protein B